jgi:hypothetical protein
MSIKGQGDFFFDNRKGGMQNTYVPETFIILVYI